MPITRRKITGLIAALPFVNVTTAATARTTPRATEGPFYPTQKMRFKDADNDLVKIAGVVREAGGEIVVLKGRVFDPSGAPTAGARVEIWQCDTNGVYLHSSDRRGKDYDTAFQGFGHVVTGDDGAYAFRTIMPVTYPGRTPHIHVKVKHESRDLTTQFYLEEEAGQNQRDRLFRRMSKAEQQAVMMRFEAGSDGPEAVVDIFL